jgi:2-succinyl-5-enolpyruvyl-6-hydroxy-3-cyclohexene-1-carboxylate synthase
MIQKKTQEYVFSFLKEYMINGEYMLLEDSLEFILTSSSNKLLDETITIELGSHLTLDKQVHSLSIGTRYEFWEVSQELKDYHNSLANNRVLGHRTFQELTDEIDLKENQLEWWLEWEKIHQTYFGDIEEINYPF